MALKTDFLDDILNTSVNSKRKYNLIYNSDGTVSLQDVTTYTQTGDLFGAAEINETNKAVNALNTNLPELFGLYTQAMTTPNNASSGRLYISRNNITGEVDIYGTIVMNNTAIGAYLIYNVIDAIGSAFTPRGTFVGVAKTGGYSSTGVTGVEIREDGGIRVNTTATNQTIAFQLKYVSSVNSMISVT